MPRLTSRLTGTYVKSLEAPLPFALFFIEASHWPSDRMISCRPLIGPPSTPPPGPSLSFFFGDAACVFNWYWCFYTYQSRELVSPVRWISFLYLFQFYIIKLIQEIETQIESLLCNLYQ